MGCCSSAEVAPDNCPQLRGEISKLLEVMRTLKTDRYKFTMLLEGLRINNAEYNAKVLKLKDEVSAAKAIRRNYLDHLYERDADDIRRACEGFGVDKSALVSIINNRTDEQLECVNSEYQSKYGSSLIKVLESELTSATGGVFTGSLSDMGTLLVNRLSPPAERDARLIFECCDGLGTSDDALIEILSTRSKDEMLAAKTTFAQLYKKEMYDVVKSEISFANYRDLALRIISANRSTVDEAINDNSVEDYCKNIYKKLDVFISVDGEEINNLMSTHVTPVVFQQLNEAYSRVNKCRQDLITHIKDKTGGSYQKFLISLGSNKFDVWCESVATALNSIIVDKSALNRILGCFNKRDAAIFRKKFDQKYTSTTLEQLLRNKLSDLYLENCLHLVLSSDNENIGALAVHMSPTGNNREKGEEDKRAQGAGAKMCEEEVKRFAEHPYVTRAEATNIPKPEISIPEWDGVGVSMDENALRGLITNYTRENITLKDELKPLKGAVEQEKGRYFNLVGNNTELDEYKKMTDLCSKGLEKHIAIRDAKDVHLFAATATDILSSQAVMDNLVHIVCERSRKQISDTSAEFYLLYDKLEMAEYVKNEMNDSDFSQFIYYVIASSSTIGPNSEYSVAYPGNIVLDVRSIREATKGWSSWLSGGTNDNVLLEVLFCRTNEEVKQLKSCWLDRFKITLEEEILKEIGDNNYNLLFQGCLLGKRDETGSINVDVANTIADGIVSQGLQKIWADGISNSVCKQFIDALAQSSDAQLAQIAAAYKDKKGDGSSIIDAINTAFANDAQLAQAISGKFVSREVYLAQRLEAGMSSMVTDKTTLARILACLSKEDVTAVDAAYTATFNKPFNAALAVALSNNPNFLKAIRSFVYKVCQWMCYF